MEHHSDVHPNDNSRSSTALCINLYITISRFFKKIGTVLVYMKYEFHWTYAGKIRILTNYRPDHGVDDGRLKGSSVKKLLG